MKRIGESNCHFRQEAINAIIKVWKTGMEHMWSNATNMYLYSSCCSLIFHCWLSFLHCLIIFEKHHTKNRFMLIKPEKTSSHDCVKGFTCKSLAIMFHLKLVQTKEITVQLLKIMNIRSVVKQQDFASPFIFDSVILMALKIILQRLSKVLEVK